MDKYSKDKIVFKRNIKCLIIVLLIIITICIAFIIYINTQNIIEFNNYDDSAIYISDEKAKLSTPIILNNIILGGVYKDEWVSTARYYNMSDYKEDTEVRFYCDEGSSGVFTIQKVGQSLTNFIALTDSLNEVTEYVAVINSETLNYIPKTSKIDYQDSTEYNENIKDALGLYTILNDSIKVNNGYECYISSNEKVTLLEVTSNSLENSNDAYSAIIMIDSKNKSYLVSYNYVNDNEKAEDFKIYSVKFVIDLNEDGINEIVISGTDEFETSYSVLEFENNKFTCVLSETIKN